METFLKDFRYGFRTLIKSPGFTAVAVLTLALGIGVNSAIFSVVNAVLLRPLPYADSHRLVLINHDYPQLKLKASVSAWGYRYYREHAKSFESIAAMTGSSFSLTGSGEPERLSGMLVSSNFFTTLGVTSLYGRTFFAEEEEFGKHKVAVLSHGLWQRRFGGETEIVNRNITLSGESYTVVGIMPAHFQFGRELGPAVDLWLPAAFPPEILTPNNLTNEFLQVIARLKPNLSLRAAQAEMDRIAVDLRRQYMNNRDRGYWGLLVEDAQERLVGGELRRALFILQGAVGFVLLIACANVANLLLARGAARQREIAIRGALGAGRRRIIRQLVIESVSLGLLGGALGLLLAFWGVELLSVLEELRIPRAHEISLDSRVVVFTFAVSFLTGLLSGLAPAFQGSRSQYEALKEGGRTGSAGARHRMRSGLVMLETALALVLLIGAGLLAKSFQRLQLVSPGFEPRQTLTMHLALPETKYAEPQQVERFYHQLLEEIRTLPGVVSAGAISILPMSGRGSSGSFRIEGKEIPEGEQSPHGARWVATPDYFPTIKIPLIRGRYFSERDTADAPGVVIIDEGLARKYWPDEDPIGKRISFEGSEENGEFKRSWRQVVGIVGHVKHEGLEGESRVQYYLPFRQPVGQRPRRDMFIVVRSASDPAGLAAPVRSVIKKLDQDLPVFRVSTMERLVSDSLAARRFSTFLLGAFAGLALLLAAVGIYGVTAYSVAQRTHEVGLRMALGAQRGDVLKLVVARGMLLTSVGLFVGLAGAFGLTRLLSTLLFGVGTTDPTTFAGVPIFLLFTSFLACYLPARRAAKVDPMVALRYE